jgi:mannose-6-phosphate isomerase-like protein (cupin superfamily)
MGDVKSTLQVFNEADLKSENGFTKGQTVKRLLGHSEHPTERIRAILASYIPGAVEQLHWHTIEAFYYVVSGRAIMRDIEGKTYDAGPGTVVYAPAGIAGSHEWEAPEPLQLIAFRATTDPERRLQFTVDRSTLVSKIDLDELIKRAGVRFKSLY